MSRYIPRNCKLILITLSVTAAVAFAAASLAIPDGGWVLTPSIECEDPNLLCAVWEFSSGQTTPPCCITMSDFATDSHLCTSYEFRIIP